MTSSGKKVTISLAVLVVVVGIVSGVALATSSNHSTRPIAYPYGVEAACNSDAKTLDVAIAAYQTDLSLPIGTQVTKADLLNPREGTLQYWFPANQYYAVAIAGDDNALVGTVSADTPPVHFTRDDVVVEVLGSSSSKYFDETQDPAGACATMAYVPPSSSS
jgi:hypothetical protein